MPVLTHWLCFSRQIGLQRSLSVYGGADVDQGGQAGQGLFDQHCEDVHELQDFGSVSLRGCLATLKKRSDLNAVQ